MFQTQKISQITKGDLNKLIEYVKEFFIEPDGLVEFTLQRNTHFVRSAKRCGQTNGFAFFSLEEFNTQPIAMASAFLGLTVIEPGSNPYSMFNLIKALNNSVFETGGKVIRVAWGRTADPIILEFVGRAFTELWPSPPIPVQPNKTTRAVIQHSGWQSDAKLPFLSTTTVGHRFNKRHIERLNHTRSKSQFAPFFDPSFFNAAAGDRVIFHALVKPNASAIIP